MHSFILLFYSNSVSPRFVFPTTRLGPESQFSDFLDGLGPAQIVGRQTLATHPMGKPRVTHNTSLSVSFCSSSVNTDVCKRM